MSTQPSEGQALACLLSAAAIVDARSYHYRWTAAEVTCTSLIEAIDIRQGTPIVKSHGFVVSPSSTIESLRHALIHSDSVFADHGLKGTFTVILASSSEQASKYFLDSSATTPRGVLAILSSSHEVHFLPTPSSDRWLPERCASVLRAISSLPDTTPLASLSYFSAEEQKFLLDLGQDSGLPSEVIQPCLHHYFEEVARTSPDLPALAFDAQDAITTLTYGEMDRRCSALAAHLATVHDVGPGVMVPVFFGRSIDMMIAILAVLKTGASYVPLDTEHPADRTAVIVSAVEAKIVLTETALLHDVRNRLDKSVSLVAIDTLHSLEVPEGGFSGRGCGDDLAYVLFTSGTTGTPKGVMVHHAAAVSTVVNGPQFNRNLRKRAGLRVFLSSNYAFDFTIWDIFIPLTSGGCLCLASKEATFDDINGVLRRLSVNVVMATPTVLSLVEPSEVPSIDAIGSGGEMLTVVVRDRVLKAGLKLGNIYGPTETTVCCVFSEVDETMTDPTIIGRPYGENRVYVLDDELRMVPHGAVGTLWIAGPQVSKGYLGRPDLTEASFRPDPFFPGERMYNSGDLCAWVERGFLKCYGRADQQVKIRGQRIEILEIEMAITRVPDVFNACVVKRVKDGREDLVGFYSLQTHTTTPDTVDVERRISQAISESLPVYMQPTTFVHLEKLPVTANGKADRKLLAQQALDTGSTITALRSPESRSEVEESIAQCWSHALSLPLDAVPCDADFYQCGGDSISIIRLAAAMRSSGLRVKTSDLRVATTVTAQAKLVLSRGAESTLEQDEKSYEAFSLLPVASVSVDVVAALVGYPKDAVEDAYPCTSTVSGLISLAASNPQSYFAQHAFRRHGRYNSDSLITAWKAVVGRHPILRTAFVIPPAPATEILQVVLKPEAFDIPWIMHTASTVEDADHSLAEYMETCREEGFKLGVVPTRIALFEGVSTSTMVLQVHHSQYDGWSLPVILDDLQKAYESLEASQSMTLNSPPLPYSHFVAWTREQSIPDALMFWKSELEDAALLTWPKVPHDSNDIATDRLVSATWTPPPEHDIAQFCSIHKATVSSFIRLALAVVLGVHANSDDVLFGVVTSGRSGDLSGIESVVGPCIATLPFRIRLPSTTPLESLLGEIQEHSSSAAAYEYVGLSDIIKGSQFARSRGIFQVLLTVENIPELDLQAHPLFGEDVHGHQMEMNYPLGVTVFLLPENRGLKIDIEYDSKHLTQDDIRWFESHLLATLDAILRTPSSALAELDIVTADERAFLQKVGIGLTPDPILTSEPFVHRLIEKAAAAYPDRIAVEHMGGTTLTYSALDALANRAAHGLRAREVALETPIPVLFNKDMDQTEAVVAIFAVMKSGGAFVPLDVSWPSARILSCVRQCAAPFVVCDGAVPDVARELPVPFVTTSELAAGQSEEPCVVEDQAPGSLAYVIFTSGSTGEPKGVMIEHRNIMGYVANGTTVYPILDVKRLLHFSPFSFDQGLGDIFMALTKGATLVLANMSDVLTDLSNVLNTTRVDYTVLTPAIAQLIRNDVDHPYLKSLLVGGEKLPGQLVDRWKGKVAFMDDYGPTEVTVSCVGMTFTETTNVAAGVIGSPYGDTRAYIVDPANPHRLLPVGAVGELCLSGNQVGRGYLNRPDLTAAAFVPDPFAPGLTMYRSGDRARWTSAGRIEYLGRQDDAFVKLRGLRVDAGEVEDALVGAGDAFAVVELLELRGQPHLVAFVSRALASAGEAALALVASEESSEELRAWLAGLVRACRQAVPAYAVPTVWLALKEMPQNANSKVDRKQLRRFFAALPAADVEAFSAAATQTRAPRAPRTAVEKAVARVWCDVLVREEGALSVHDDFFALGGDSIGVVRMLAGLRALGLDVSLKEFAAGSTVAEIAASFDAASSAGTSSPGELSDSGLPGAGSGLVWQVQSNESSDIPLWMIHDGGGLGNEYKNMTSLARPVYAISNAATTVSEIQGWFPSFDSYASAYASLLPSEDDIFLGGWSIGGTIALSLAARRLAAGQRVRGVVLIDSYNSSGWKHTGSSALEEADAARTLSADEYVRAHQAHVDTLVGEFTPKMYDFPVLLVRAGVGREMEEIEHAGFVVPYLRPGAEKSVDSGIGGIDTGEVVEAQACEREELRFWTREILPKLEVVTIEGADHYSLMRDGALCARASDEVAGWLAKVGK